MTTITIEYPFFTFKRKVTGSVPQRWEEVTEKQFIALARILSGEELNFRFLAVLTGIRERLIRQLTPFEIFSITEGIDFISRSGNFHYDFFIKRIPGTKLTAPKPKLSGMTFGQFIYTESYYNDWITVSREGKESKDDKTLNNFIASLYTLQNSKFSEVLIPKNARQIGKSPFFLRNAIAFNYAFVMVWLQKSYPLVFQEKGEGADEKGKADKKLSDSARQNTWLKLFDSLIGDDLINRDRYAELPIHVVLKHLTAKYKENSRRG